MNRPDQHPDTESLDRLRSGLLDENPALKSELEAHLAQCKKCRHLYDWPGALRAPDRHTDSVENHLDRARQQALASTPVSTLRRFAPLATAAAVALVTIVSLNHWQANDTTETQMAGNTRQDVPEVYEDLDFYLWLSDHKADRDSST